MEKEIWDKVSDQRKKDIIYIFFLPPVGSILIRKFLSEEGFEPPCANYDPAVLTD